MSYAWKLRHENNSIGEIREVPKFTGFASSTEEDLSKQNKDFENTDLKDWIKPFLNKHSNVRLLDENSVMTIKVTAVKCCNNGMYESSIELKFNYSDKYESLPNIPDFPHYIVEAQELAEYLGIAYRD